MTYQRLWGRMATFWPSAFVQSVQVSNSSCAFDRMKVTEKSTCWDQHHPGAKAISREDSCPYYGFGMLRMFHNFFCMNDFTVGRNRESQKR